MNARLDLVTDGNVALDVALHHQPTLTKTTSRRSAQCDSVSWTRPGKKPERSANVPLYVPCRGSPNFSYNSCSLPIAACLPACRRVFVLPAVTAKGH